MALSSFISSRDHPWEPLGTLGAFADPFETLGVWDRAPARSFARDASAAARTRVDWRETPDAHVITAELPGLNKEDIKVEVEDGNILKISGDRPRDQVDGTDRWHRVERSFGTFLRRFRLPDYVDTDKMTATSENGVLKITIPKKGVKKHESREIPVEWQDLPHPRIEEVAG